MKKTYQNPETKTVLLQTTHMIAVSIQMNATNATDAGMSRSDDDSAWGDEEE